MLNTANRWNVVGAAAILMLSLVLALVPDYRIAVEGVISKLVKAAIGGYFGYLVSRYVVRLNLSEIAYDQRPVAAISQSILIVGFALAVAGLF